MPSCTQSRETTDEATSTAPMVAYPVDRFDLRVINAVLHPAQGNDRRSDLRILVRYVGQFSDRLDFYSVNAVPNPAQRDDGTK